MPTTTQNLCYNCFAQRESPEGPCPYCGFDLEENAKKFPVALRAGTVLNDRYIVGRVLGQGGFGITYLAFDTQLQAKVAVKEYMPNDIATRIEGTTVSVAMETKADDFTYGAERFQEEARTLAKFIGHPNIAGVSSYFDENDTSYFVMDYIEGVSFKNYIANNGGKVSVDEALNVMIPVLRALTAVHAEGFIHRDVTPDNIYISKDGNVKLLDFGSARYSIGDKSKSLDVILKVGYAPKEQYIRRGRQGPYTDVYSCAACFYAALTGVLPPESLERLDHDELVPVSQAGIDIPDWLDRAILKGLAVQPEDRFQSAAEFLDAIENQIAVEVPGAAPAEPPQPVQKKNKAPVIAAVAALLAVAVGLGAFFGLRDGGSAGPAADLPGEEQEEEQPERKKAEVPSITIQGVEYGTDLRKLELENMGLTDGDILDLKYMINLTYLNLDGNNLTDLSPVSGLTELEQINVMNNPDLTDLSPLAGLTGLRDVNFYGSPVTDYSFMAGLTNLETVELYEIQEDTDLSFLSGLTNVRRIYTNGGSNSNSLRDLSFLSGMTGLQEISVQADMDNIDLTPLSGLTELTRLQLWTNGGTRVCAVTDLSPLAGLTKLQELNIPVEVEDLAPLAGMTELRTLRLQSYGGDQYYPLSDISALAGLTDLTELQMQLGDVRDFSPLENLTNLVSLHLYGDYQLEDISFLRGMARLKELYMSGSGEGRVLDDLSDLSGLTSLQTLQLNMGVNSFQGIEGLTNLRELRIYGGSSSRQSQFTNVDPLAGLTNLVTLSLPYRDYESPPYNIDGLAGLTKLQELEINSEVESLEPLRGLTALKTLRYQTNGVYERPATSLEPLADLTGLSEFYFSGKVAGSDLTPLGKMTGLRSLTVYHQDWQNPIRDLSPLKDLTNLSSLTVSGTQEGIDTSSVSFISGLNIS